MSNAFALAPCEVHLITVMAIVAVTFAWLWIAANARAVIAETQRLRARQTDQSQRDSLRY
jgi:hypothetical protein